MWLLLLAVAPAAEVSAAYGVSSFQSFWDITGARWVEVAGSVEPYPALSLGLGARRLFSGAVVPATAFDGFLRARVAPRRSVQKVSWRPALSGELGVTGGLHYDWAEKGAAEPWWLEREDAAVTSPVYGCFTIEPVRAELGPVALSLLSIGVGSTLPDWGKVVRFDLGWARAGFQW